MKVYISKYRNHWISPYTILEKVCFWENDKDVFYNLSDEPNHKYEKAVNFLTPICEFILKFLDKVHPKINYVKIDKWDTWSMDHTLSHLVVPMLKQLKATKHGAPHVDDEDVPEHLKSTSAPPKEHDYDVDDNHFKRWDWALDEMIWAFEQKLDNNPDDQFYTHPTEEERKDKSFQEQMEMIKVDREGLDAWQARKANGYRLFGKYYEGLWD